MPTQQQEQLARVRRVIGDRVLEFCRTHEGDQIHLVDLEDWVMKWSAATPGSAGRIMRDLRRNGYLDYTVESRSKSLYRIIRVGRVDPPTDGHLF